MKVLLCAREDYLRNFEGDSKQIIKTYEYLRKLGVDVEINSGNIYDFTDYDIIHIFDLTRVGETYKYYKIAKKYKKNIVISPLYWSLTKYYKVMNEREKIKLWKNSKIYREEILKGCCKIIANSFMEKEILNNEFNISCPIEVIYNGVEVEDETMPLYNFKERNCLDNYVLCVGKICYKKNQLMLAKACNKLGMKLVIIGKVMDKDYFKRCMEYNNVLYLGFMDSYNIYNAYRFAKVHALVSYIEKPGMSSLEAAAYGCNIVSTMEGSSKEYFKDMASYCDPYDEMSIIYAVQNAFLKKKDDVLKKYVKEKYNWGKNIKILYENYKNVYLQK